MRARALAAIGALCIALPAGPPVASGEPAASAACVELPESSRRAAALADDPTQLTSRQISAADAELRATELAADLSSTAADVHGVLQQLRDRRVVVPVFAHVLRSASGGGVPRSRVERQIRVLNRAYAGGQSARAAKSPFHFRLVDVDVTVNRSWRRMDPGTRAERRAKRALHQGDAGDLNLYIGGNRARLLGWAMQPTEYDNAPPMDGVVIARHTMPGGRGGNYSAGDAAVHETGHWLGLFHTFAGKCGSGGDLVADTPKEARASYTCPRSRNTCPWPGRDPIHNFLDYSYDRCMNQFTRGQVARMMRSWHGFRG